MTKHLKIPRFGARDVEIARCLANNYTISFGEVQEWAADVMHILQGLSDGSVVAVPKEEIDIVRRGVMFKQMSKEYIDARKTLEKWVPE